MSVEIAPGRVFCDLYYWGPKSDFYLVTALHMATGEQFWREGTFAPAPEPRETSP